MSRLKLISHPGEILKEEFLEPLGITENALAKAIGVPRSRINAIVNGKRGITADTALRLGRFFGTDHRGWINLQNRYDSVLAEETISGELASITPMTRGAAEGHKETVF